jgi:type I restriction enzyme, S subunit
MNSYPSYKDSGVEWMGEIPSDWIKSKFKYETNVPVQYGINTSSEFYIENGIRFIRTTDITDDGKIKEGGVYLEIDSVEDIYRTKINDFLISRSGTLGRTYLHNNENEMTYGGYLVRFNFGDKTKSKFIFYYSKSKNFEDWLSLNTIQSTIGNVNGQKYSNLSVPLPPKETQTQIVSFLDTKTQKIDDLIEKTQQKIELLREKRTSLINHCVTKGLNPDVEMKDSRVEWIEEIPSGWDKKKLKYFSTLFTEKEDTNKDDIKISPENVESYTGVCFNLYSEYEGKGVPFKSGDILLNKLRLYLVKILLPDYDGFSMGEMIVIRVNENVSNRYYFYLLFNQGLIDLLDSQSTGIKVPRVSPEIIMGSYLPYPPKEEQTQIVEYLDEQTQKIDSTIEKETQRIELLKEYHQSLISEVVTGKVDVRD